MLLCVFFVETSYFTRQSFSPFKTPFINYNFELFYLFLGLDVVAYGGLDCYKLD